MADEAALVLRPAVPADWPGIWRIFHAVVSAGDTYAWSPDTTEDEARELWIAPPRRTFVAEIADSIVGTYFYKPNQPGLGDHVANAGFMVAPDTAGRGVGRAMGAHALDEASRAGFQAMQFNFVVSTNARAVALWQSLGFEIVGRNPAAFRHPSAGLVDSYVMYRRLL